uniref:acyltransferase family protein n=1 Tax=Candidatus Planktophila sp. TaxID=2175601 RepID=UPI00404A8CB6
LSLDAANTSKVSHIYFGTDTHRFGLFLGAALSVSWIPQNFKITVSKRAQNFIDGVGIFGFIGILATFLLIDESQPTLYKIAFPLAGIFGAAIIMSIVHPASRFAPILEFKPLLWIGERSYAIYLWHWVIFQVTRPSVDLAGEDWALYALRILIVFALADISLRYIELPVRRGVIQYWFKGRRYRTKRERNRQTGIFSVITIIVLIVAIIVSVRAISISNQAQQKLENSLSVAATSGATGSDQALVDDGLRADDGLWVTGDSVILGIRSQLGEKLPIALINARIGRQAGELADVMRSDAAQVPNAPVIFNLGNNNLVTREQAVAIFEIVKNQPEIIVINSAVPRPWREPNNALIEEVAAQYPQVQIVDWNSLSADRPDYFAPDGVHLVPAGVSAYVDAIIERLEK